MNIFKTAVLTGLRFVSTKGHISVEDVAVLPTTKVREMANAINRKIKNSDDLFATRTKEDSLDKLRLDILVEIVEYREELAASKIDAKERAEKKARFKELIDKKKLENEENKSIEELEKLYAEM